MAISFVQGKSGTNASGATSTTSTAAFSSNTTLGNLIIVGIANDGTAGSVTSVTDTQGNSYSLVVRNTALTAVTAEIWVAVVTTAGASNVVTANQGFNDGAIFAQEWSGLATSSFTDQLARGTGSTTTMTATTAATTVANELIFAVGEVDLSGSNTITVGAGYSNFLTASSSFVRGAIESKTVSSTGAQTATMTIASGTASWRECIATFKIAPTVNKGAGFLTIMGA